MDTKKEKDLLESLWSMGKAPWKNGEILMTQQFVFREMLLRDVFFITAFHTQDERGGLIKDFSKAQFIQMGIDFEPSETLFITSRRYVLRGLHFQRVKQQSKLIRCIKGRIWCAVADLRGDSETFGQWISVELCGEGYDELYVPSGCALGTLAYEDSLIIMQCGEEFYSEYDDGIQWNDPDINIKWPLEKLEGSPVISKKDQRLQSFRNYCEVICPR